MKTQFKRFSKSTISVLLAVCLLFSCMTVGLIATSAAQDDSESVGASSTMTIYFQDNYNWGTVYAFSGNNMTVRSSNGYGYDVYGSGLNSGWQTMTKVAGTTNIFKITMTVYDGKVAFAKAKSNQAGYFNNCNQCAVTPSGMSSGKLLNIWTGSNDEVRNMNSTSYRKYDLKDYTPPVALTTRIYVKTGLKNKGNITMTNAYIWSNGSDTWDTGAWPGQALTDSSWSTAGSFKYRDFTTYNYDKFKIILTDGASSNAKQTDDSAEYATGKTWVFDSVDTTSGSNGKAVGTEGYPVEIGTVSGGTVTPNKTVAKSGDTVTLTATPNSGHAAVKPTVTKAGSGTVTVSGSSSPYTFSMPSDAVTVTATFPSVPALDTPTISFANSTVTANPSGNATLNISNHSTISGKDSGVTYELYKNGTKVTQSATTYTYSNGVFTIPARYSNRATTTGYTVKAIASNASHTDSATSSAAKLTINKQTVAKPTITIDKTDIPSGSNATITVTNASSYTNYTLKLYKGSTQQSNTFTNGATTVNTAGTYKVKAISSNAEYYADSADSDTVTLTVSTASWYVLGDIASGGSWSPNTTAANKIGDYSEANVFSKTVTTTGACYFGLSNDNKRYQPQGSNYSTSYDVTNCSTKATAKQLEQSPSSDEGSFKIPSAGTYVIYIDQSTKKVWVTQNTWLVTTVARVKDYDVSKGSYKAVENSTSAKGTASPATVNVTKGESTTLTASAGTGYSFVGWYTNEACTTAASGSYTSASYSVTPAANTTYYALFKQNEPAKVNISVANVTGATISATWNGTTKTNGQTLSNVPVGAEVSVTVTPATGKYVVSTTPTLTSGKFTVTASTTSITATLDNLLKITSTTNKTAWGTVSTSPEYARPGDLITITCTPAAGTLSTLVAYDTTNQAVVKSWKRNSSGQMVVENQVQNSANQFTQVGLSGIAGSIYSFIKDAGEALGAADDSKAVGDDPLTFNMPAGAVSVTATYEDYVGTSEYYYNYYSNSGKGNSTQMSEGRIDGNAYGYYNVTDRTGDDQPFTVSHRTEVTGTRYVYFTCPGSWNNLHVYFFDGVEMNWPGAEMQGASETGNSNYKYAIPSGAKKVIFNNGNNSYQTVNIDLTNTNGAYYVSSGEQSTSASVGQWQNPPGDAGINGFTETEYFSDQNDHDIYPASYQAYTNAGLFNDQGIGNTRVAKPKGDDFGDKKTDYYILVFYPGVTYTINDKTFTPEGNPLVYWSTTLPGQTPEENPTVKVYAKDGAIRRDGDKPERNDRTYSYFEQHANTFVYSDSGYASHIGTRSSYDSQSSEGSSDYNGYTYDYVNKFNKGDTLYIKTNLDSTLKENYYLAAYCINGKTYELHAASESDDGVVTEAFTVPEDWEDKYVEITPIYFLRDSAGTNTITFYIEGYDETVMNAGWGNTPFVYPFYQDANFNYVSNINNAFGGYPGQPMVFYKGNYYIQLPKEITTTISTGQTGTATIKGVTLGNGYWDDIHYHIGEVKSHFQTYDYDDLYKIYNEKGNADRIICAFKYRTKKNNDEPSAPVTYSNYNSTNGNGWEVLTNYYGQPVDVFGNVLSGDAETLARSIMAGTTSADTAAVVHAISQDYKSNSAGDYATEWVIYNTSGTKVVASSGGKTSIVPSALAINANTTGTGELTANFDKYDNATKAFKSIYTALYNDTNVRNKPAVVTYEKSIYGGGDKADRCDARWYFSQKNAPITATTRIEYTDDGKTWNTDTYTSGTGTGSTTGTKAYFTGKASTATDTPSTTTGIDDTNTTTYSGNVGQGYYTIKAENAGQYQFVGWYLLRDNYQNISTRSSYAADATEFPSHAEMSKNGDIFVARFKKTATGTFDIYHEIHPQTTGYGNVSVSAVVINSSEAQVASYPASGTTDHVTIPSNYIRSGEGYKVVATFTATPYNTSNFNAFYATVQDLLEGYKEYDFIDSIQINADATGGTATVTYNVDKMFSMASGSPVQTVTNVTHYSKFSLKTNLTYSLEYTFNTRYYGTKLYKYTNVKFTEQELRSYFLNQITDPNCNHIKLDKQFVKAKAPFESNFREDLTWVVDNVTFNNVNDPTIGYLTATQVSKKWATAMVYDFDNNGEMQTKTMVAPFEKLFNESVNTKPTYQSDEAEAQAINAWSVDNDAMYHPLRTSYVPAGGTSSAPLYIDHWDIYQLDSFTYKTVNNNPKMMDDGYNLDVDLSKSVLVAQAYSSRFNYVGYEDYVVVPVYNKDKVDRQGASDNRTDSSATLLTLTRNQWNANVAGNTQGGSYINSADRVYVDFMLNYNYSVNVNGKQTNILLNSTGDNIKVGFIVRSYTWENEQKQYGKAQYVLVDKDQINDKNRMEYCFGFNNSENNRKAGLYYEFKPFIVDTDNQGASAGCDVKIGNQTYKALYADSTVSVLDHVSFYQLGRL